MDYAGFIDKKTQLGESHGFEPNFMPDFLFDFQRYATDWAVRKGRAALFEDCGLGKTVQELVYGQNVAQHTNKPVILATPLAVGYQTVAEAGKFGIECYLMREAPVSKLKAAIYVTNYERLHYFNPHDFAGMICDESACIKNFNGKRAGQITDFMRKMQYRLLATATAAPNDYIELGTSSEALGELGYMDMLNRFFKNDSNNSATGRGHMGEIVKWRFKGHAEQEFWRWVCSWARAIRRPSDVGFDDAAFILPPLVEKDHLIQASTLADGYLFALPAIGLKEQRDERRRTVEERCAKAAELVNHTGKQAISWCHLNDEGDLLEKLIPDSIQVSGKDSDDSKEEKLIAFAENKARVLVTKGKIGAWGLNFQNCAHMTNFPSHSFEEYYQKVRRCWRFGQKSSVQCDMITTEGERDVMKNLQRKALAADKMFSDLTAHMNDARVIARSDYKKTDVCVPAWL